MIEEHINSLNYGGPHRNEVFKYNPDGSVASHRVSNSDASVNNLEAAEESQNGTPQRKTRETREYDSHKNLSKLTMLRWNDAARDFEPFAISYYSIIYYR